MQVNHTAEGLLKVNSQGLHLWVCGISGESIAMKFLSSLVRITQRYVFTPPSSPWCISLPILWMCVLQFLSGIPNPLHFEEIGIKDTFMSDLSHAVHDFDPDFQNFMHLPLFGMLGLLWAWALQYWKHPRRLYLQWLLGIVLGYGAINELTQAFVPGRFPGLEDLSFNWIGSILAIILFLWLKRRLKPIENDV